MGKVFDELFGNAVFYYRDKKIPVKSLGLTSDYLIRFCAHMSKREWCLDGITYNKIKVIRNIGEKKARAIAEALVKQGVKITDIPEVKVNEPTRFILNEKCMTKCSNCHSVLNGIYDTAGNHFKFCPMCGKKIKIRENELPYDYEG